MPLRLDRSILFVYEKNSGSSFERSGLIVLLAFATAALAALPYLVGGLNRAFVVLDDAVYVYENSHVRDGLAWEGIRWAFSTFNAHNWHPLTWLSHMLDATLFGLDARGHHLVSILLHALNTALLFVVLTRLTGALWRSGFAAALFGVHPLRVESVAWVAERKDVLSGLFFMLLLLAYERWANRGGSRWYLAVFALLALGLMAKPMLVTAPFVLLLLDLWPLGRTPLVPPADGRAAVPRPWRRLLLEKLPLLVLCLASSVVTVLAQRQGGALKDLALYPPGIRLANALISYLRYLGMTLWPTALAVQYPYAPDMPPWWKIAAALLLLAGVSGLAVRFLRRQPAIAVGWFWFLGMLLPVIGLVQVGSQALADRYTYLPHVGLVLVVAWGVPQALRVPNRALAAVAAVVLAALASASFVQAGFWSDSETLYRRSLSVTFANTLIHNNLGVLYTGAARYAEAIEQYSAALSINHDLPETHNNLGYVLSAQGKTGEAITQLQEALRLRPGYIKAHKTLGSILAGQGRFDEARFHFNEARKLELRRERPGP